MQAHPNPAEAPPTATALDLHLILDAMPAMIGYWDRDLLNRYANSGYLYWFGLTPQAIYGKHICEVIGEELYTLNLPYITRVLNGHTEKFERAIPTVDGSDVRYSSATYIPDMISGEVKGFYVMVTDITTIRQTEMQLSVNQEKLRRSEYLYQSIIENQTELVARFKKDGTYLFVNEAYCKFFGFSKEELIGHTWHPEAHHEDRSLIEAKLNTITRENTTVVIENRVYNHTGEMRWMQFVNQGFFDIEGDLVEIQTVGRDIHERVMAESALKKSREELEQRIVERTKDLQLLTVTSIMTEERERKAIARNLHDELGQYLFVLRLKLDALSTKLPSSEKSALDELSTLISNSSRLVRSFTSQLSPTVLESLGLTSAIKWLADEMEKQYGLRIISRLPKISLSLTEVESALLFRATREFLFNVVKHALAQSAQVELIMCDDHSLILKVEDDGKGATRLYQPEVGKVGFGLATLRERIRFLGGDITFGESALGGLCVTLTLPLDQINVQLNEPPTTT